LTRVLNFTKQFSAALVSIVMGRQGGAGETLVALPSKFKPIGNSILDHFFSKNAKFEVTVPIVIAFRSKKKFFFNSEYP